MTQYSTLQTNFMMSIISSIVFIVVTFLICMTYLSVRHARQVTTTRRDWTQVDFLAEFSETQFKQKELFWTYEDIMKLSRIPPHRSDRLAEVHSLLPEDVESALVVRVRSMGLVVPDDTGSLFGRRVDTVEEYVIFLADALSLAENTHRGHS